MTATNSPCLMSKETLLRATVSISSVRNTLLKFSTCIITVYNLIGLSFMSLKVYSFAMDSTGLRSAARRLCRVTVTTVIRPMMSSAARNIHTGTGLW